MSIQEDIEKIEKKAEKLEKNSFAMELLEDYKKANKRMFIALILVLFMWFATIGYLVYILNDIGTEETTITQDAPDGNNNYIGNDGDIINGKAND